MFTLSRNTQKASHEQKCFKNERNEYMQEIQHTQQTATRTATKLIQENNMNVNGYKKIKDTQKQTNI